MREEEKAFEASGTTTVAMVFKGGVVLATDSRATMGHFIASTEAKKVYVIDKFKAMTIAGSVGDAQEIVRTLQVQSEYYKMSNDGKDMSVKACSSFLANWLSGYHKETGGYFNVQIIIGGVDRGGSSIYSIDATGGRIGDEAISTGSGSPGAYGVLENFFREDLTKEEAIDVAVRAIHTATKRDAASGNSIKVLTITKEEGCEEVPIFYVEKMVKKIGKTKKRRR